MLIDWVVVISPQFIAIFPLFFSDALSDLSGQLMGAYNIETVVGPIDIKLSNAIMNYQDQTGQITETVSVRPSS